MNYEQPNPTTIMDRVVTGFIKVFRMFPEAIDMPNDPELSKRHARASNPYIISPYAVITHATEQFTSGTSA